MRHASAFGASLKYGPLAVWVLTCWIQGPRLAGSLTGVVASKSVTEAPQGALRPIGNRPQSVMAEGRLTGSRQAAQAGNWSIVIRRFRMEGPSLKG